MQNIFKYMTNKDYVIVYVTKQHFTDKVIYIAEKQKNTSIHKLIFARNIYKNLSMTYELKIK